MKISKLFHWLYACLMLLPIFAIGSKLLYVAFNPNAKDSYFAEEINENINVPVNINELVVNNDYTLYLPIQPNTLTGSFYLYFNGDIIVNNTLYTDKQYISIFNNSGSAYFGIYQSGASTIYINNSQTTIDLKFNFASLTSTSNLTYQLFKVEYNDYSFIDNALYYAVNQINEEPLFSWAKDSFLVVPFHSIGNLFGLPNNSPIYTMLSYWLNISITWLVFDLVMYVPLLAHRWIDKGVLE